MDIAWKAEGEDVFILDCGVVVVQVRRDADGKWYPTASHGAPEGLYDTLEEAQDVGKQFVVSTLEDALLRISHLATNRIDKSPGGMPSVWRPRGAGAVATCGAVSLRAEEDDSWYDEVPETMSMDDAVEAAAKAGVDPKLLVGQKRLVKKLKPRAAELAKAKAINEARANIRGIIASLGN